MGFFDWLSKASIGEIIGALFGLIAMFAAVIIGLSFLLKRVKLRVGKVSLGGAVEEEEEVQAGTLVDAKPPHATCPHAKDVIRVLHEQSRIREELKGIPYDLVAEQMKYAESIWVEICRLMESVVLKALKDLGGGAAPVEHPDYKHLLPVLSDIELIVKDAIRKWFRENHYAEKTLAERTEYIKMKKFELVDMTRERLNVTWAGVALDRGTLYNLNQQVRPEAENLIERIFQYAFSKADEAQTKIETLEQEEARMIEEYITG